MKPSIVAVLEHYGAFSIPNRDAWTAIRCPFHDDRRASASVNLDEEIFTCHACGIKGDAFAVVMQAEGIGFPEAKEKVAQITGVSADDLTALGRTRGDGAGGRSKLPIWTRNRRTRKRVFA